jgi:hypothetical protein
MKKRIFYYEQQRLLDSNLEPDELIILDYISHFKNSGKMEEHIKDGKCWNWISWKKVADDLPFLRLKKEAIQRKCLYYLGIKPLDWEERVLKMTESTKKKVKSYKFLGLIEFDTVGELGSEKTVFRFTNKWYKLIEEDGETEHKKADTLPQVPTTTNKTNYTKSIQQNNKKYNPKFTENKNKFRNFEESFLDYSEEELDMIIENNQRDKLNIL